MDVGFVSRVDQQRDLIEVIVELSQG